MKIERIQITVGELAKGFFNDEETGHVEAYSGKLNVRPEYQREFIYKDSQRNAVVDTVLKGFPLNTMYWAKCDDGTFEVIDGQQRTISICQYVNGDFSINIDNHQRAFHNLEDEQQQKINNYPLDIYLCDGGNDEKLDWFRVINIAGEKLTDQELRNAIFHGPWVNDAKRFFAKNGFIKEKAAAYLNGSAERQDYLETAIKWISGGMVDMYMSAHQHDPNAAELRTYFMNVINWIEETFRPTKEYKKIMKGVDWGTLYANYKDKKIDLNEFDEKVDELILDDDVTRNTGIYPYLLTGKESYLSIRAFSPAQRLKAYKLCSGQCCKCGKLCELDEMEADHITPWSKGGHTTDDNIQMLCRDCNRTKSDI